jgi:EAL domain-containing protein (putative c-di-GMP-specific phosphodiesterase class I)
MSFGDLESRVAAVPLHWRVRSTLWLLAMVPVATVALVGPARLAAALAAGLLSLLLVVGEPTVQAVRRRAGQPDALPAASTWPAEPAAAPGAALARALAEGDVTVLYRPLCSLPALVLCGVEAELRWRHLLHGLQPPDEWPPGLPPALADAVLDAWLTPACVQFAHWLPRLDRHADATLWLRLPARLLDAPGLPAALDRALAASGLGAERLRLRVAPQEVGRQAALPEAARRLQQQGHVLVADGFGAGAASLTHLQALPVCAVSLDRSLIERAGRGASQRLVVESTARLAASLGMLTLADGVSSQAQVLALGALGCQLGLGEVCGPWLEADDWTQRWLAPRFVNTL